MDKTDVTIKNVNFVFDPADFTLCMNSDWKGSFSKDDIKNAEFQFLNSGKVTIDNCSFDGVIVSPFSSRDTTTITKCTFKNVYNAYALKDIHSPNASIQYCTFDNCGGGIYFEGDTSKNEYTILHNTFENIDTNAPTEKQGTRGLIQFSSHGDYSNAKLLLVTTPQPAMQPLFAN